MRWAIVISALVLVSSASAVLKPWQWTPAQARQAIEREESKSFYYGREDGIEVTLPWELIQVSCRGSGKRLAGRFSAFRCPVVFRRGNATAPERRLVMWVKVRKVGSGSVCLSLVSLASVPTGCLTRGSRATPSLREAYNAMIQTVGSINHDFRCRNNGSSFYSCSWQVGPTATVVTHRGTVKLTPSGPVVKVLS